MWVIDHFIYYDLLLIKNKLLTEVWLAPFLYKEDLNRSLSPTLSICR